MEIERTKNSQTNFETEFNGERIIFTINGTDTILYQYVKNKKKENPQSLLYIIYKNQLKWHIDLNIRAKRMQFIKEIIRKNP